MPDFASPEQLEQPIEDLQFPEIEDGQKIPEEKEDAYVERMQALMDGIRDARGSEVSIKQSFTGAEIEHADGTRSVLWNGENIRSDGFDDGSQREMKEQGFMVYGEYNSGSVLVNEYETASGDRVTEYVLFQFEDTPESIDDFSPEYSFVENELSSVTNAPAEALQPLNTSKSAEKKKPWFLDLIFSGEMSVQSPQKQHELTVFDTSTHPAPFQLVPEPTIGNVSFFEEVVNDLSQLTTDNQVPTEKTTTVGEIMSSLSHVPDARASTPEPSVAPVDSVPAVQSDSSELITPILVIQTKEIQSISKVEQVVLPSAELLAQKFDAPSDFPEAPNVISVPNSFPATTTPLELSPLTAELPTAAERVEIDEEHSAPTLEQPVHSQSERVMPSEALSTAEHSVLLEQTLDASPVSPAHEGEEVPGQALSIPSTMRGDTSAAAPRPRELVAIEIQPMPTTSQDDESSEIGEIPQEMLATEVPREPLVKRESVNSVEAAIAEIRAIETRTRPRSEVSPEIPAKSGARNSLEEITAHKLTATRAEVQHLPRVEAPRVIAYMEMVQARETTPESVAIPLQEFIVGAPELARQMEVFSQPEPREIVLVGERTQGKIIDATIIRKEDTGEVSYEFRQRPIPPREKTHVAARQKLKHYAWQVPTVQKKKPLVRVITITTEPGERRNQLEAVATAREQVEVRLESERSVAWKTPLSVPLDPTNEEQPRKKLSSARERSPRTLAA